VSALPPIRFLVAIAAVAVIGLVLFEFFVSFLLPQRVKREARFARWVLVALWRTWRFGARRLRAPNAETFLGYFGPIGLLAMLATWVVALIVAFAALQWALGDGLVRPGPNGVVRDLYYSGGTFFSAATDLRAVGGARLVEITEAIAGYLVLFAAIGYVPALFQAYSRREVAVSQLDPRAGSPPSPGTLLYRSARRGGWSELDAYLAEWEGWAAELMETHLSYPLLAFYRSQHVNQNWLAALVTVLDTAAFAIAVAPERTPAAEVTFAIGRHALADLAYTFRARGKEGGERLDRESFARLRANIGDAGLEVAHPEESYLELADLRALYEPQAQALSRRLELTLPLWVREERTENWRLSAWRERRSQTALH
jgi:hypothetical protein